MSNKVQIGLLSPFFQPIPAYEGPARDLGVDLVLVTAKRIDWKRHEVDGLVYDGQAWEERTVPLPPSLYNRYYGPKPKVVSRLETIIGRNKIFNHVTRFDKWEIHQLLGQSGLKDHLPATAPYSPENLGWFLRRFAQAVLKPASGQLGNRIYLVRSEQGVYYLHHGTKSPVAHFRSFADLVLGLEAAVDSEFIVQEFIHLAAVGRRVFDIRLLVQKNGSGIWQVTGMLSRLAASYSFVTNLCQVICPAEEALDRAFPGANLLPVLKGLSLKAAQAAETSLGSLGELSVDFGLDEQGGVWIVELNAKPMKSTFAALGDDLLLQEVYLQPLRYALYLAAA